VFTHGRDGSDGEKASKPAMKKPANKVPDLNVVKKALEVVFHKPFQIKERGYTGRLKELMEGMRKEMNVRMAKDFVDRRFGGEGAFSLLGDQVKAFHPRCRARLLERR